MLEERKEGMFMNVWLLTNALGHKSYRRILEKKIEIRGNASKYGSIATSAACLIDSSPHTLVPLFRCSLSFYRPLLNLFDNLSPEQGNDMSVAEITIMTIGVNRQI